MDKSLMIVYTVCVFLFDMFLLSAAIIIPVWITPGYYWLSALCLLILTGASSSYTYRLNEYIKRNS